MRLIIGIFLASVLLTAISPESWAICKNVDSIMVADDSYLPVMSSEFDPCDTWLIWEVWFYRNQDYTGSTVITFEIHGNADVFKQWDSAETANGNRYYSDTVYVGSSQSERLFMDRSGSSSVKFTNIKAKATFISKPIERPGEN
jgi:hypothetical protein